MALEGYSRTGFDAHRERAAAEPDVLAKSFWTAAKEGRDVRTLTALFDRLHADDAYVPMPTSLDKLDGYTSEERRTLLRQIEGKLGPTNGGQSTYQGRAGVTAMSSPALAVSGCSGVSAASASIPLSEVCLGSPFGTPCRSTLSFDDDGRRFVGVS